MSKTISMVFGIALALPVVKARNSFRFERDSADLWTATLSYRATAEKPAREHVYRMERWPGR